MKKNLILIGSALLLVISLACSGEDDEVDPIVPDNNEQPANNAETNENNTNINQMNIQVGDTILKVTLADNSSVDALVAALAEAPITVDMRDYGDMEKVGDLGRSFPTNDESITTEAGDVILYQGRALVIYYAPNSWSFTRLGKIENTSGEELKRILGNANVQVTLSISGE